MACSMPPMYWSTGNQFHRPDRWRGRDLVDGVAQEVPGRSPRRCPSCRSRVAPVRRTWGRSCSPTRRSARAATCTLPGTPRSRQHHRQILFRVPGTIRRWRSRPWGWACPSSAGAKSASRAAGYWSSPVPSPLPRRQRDARDDFFGAARPLNGPELTSRAFMLRRRLGQVASVQRYWPSRWQNHGTDGQAERARRTRSRAGRAPAPP